MLLLQGYFAPEPGARICAPCPLGFFGQNASATACQSCDAPLFSQAPATRQCSACFESLYPVFHDAAARTFSACRPCPTGAVCPGLTNMSISSRYYATLNPTTLAVETFLCDRNRCGANFTCGPNRAAAEDNPLCGRCLPGYSEWDGTCISCSGVNGGLVLGLLLLACACVLAIHSIAQRASTSSSLRIVMFFWQVSFLIVGSATWVRWASFLDLDFFAAGSGSGSVCPFPIAPHGALVLKLLGPLLSYALLAATAGLHRGLQLLQRCDFARRRLPRFEPAAYWRTVLTLYFFTFNSVTRTCLSFFSCVSLTNGARFMVALPAVSCDEAAYRGLSPLVALLLASYTVAIPGFIGYRLRDIHRLRLQLQARGHGHDQSELAMARVWSVVYGPLRTEVFWWSMAQMLARAALVAAAVYLRANDHARYAVFALINGVSVVLALHYKPNRSANDNAWELGTLLSLALLAQSEIMDAPDGWLAALTLGVGTAVAARLAVQSWRRARLGQLQAAADRNAPVGDEPSASRASLLQPHDHDHVHDADGVALSSTAYVRLDGTGRGAGDA
jgi:hypothetical protein